LVWFRKKNIVQKLRLIFTILFNLKTNSILVVVQELKDRYSHGSCSWTVLDEPDPNVVDLKIDVLSF